MWPRRKGKEENVSWVLPVTLFCDMWRTTPVAHVVVGVRYLGDERHVGYMQFSCRRFESR
jgi:hypothetical protein